MFGIFLVWELSNILGPGFTLFRDVEHRPHGNDHLERVLRSGCPHVVSDDDIVLEFDRLHWLCRQIAHPLRRAW